MIASTQMHNKQWSKNQQVDVVDNGGIYLSEISTSFLQQTSSYLTIEKIIDNSV
jgi:hypothetical protein